MKFESVPIPVGTGDADRSATMLLGGIAVAAVLVALSAPRLFGLLALAAGGTAGGLILG